jgi:hypothetical protein
VPGVAKWQLACFEILNPAVSFEVAHLYGTPARVTGRPILIDPV